MQSMTFASASQFHIYIVGLRLCLSNLNVKALVGTFNQKKALVGAFSMIVKSLRTFVSSSNTRTGDDCRQRARRHCSGLTFHRPLGCSEAEYADCLQLIRPEEISCEEARVLGPDTGAEEEADPCLMEKVVGRCRGAFNRFYFDAGTKSCQSFKYGGCMGNGNNFSDRRACEAACGRHLPQPRQTPRTMRPTPGNPVCQLPMEAGPCYALMPRFFFNFESRRCEQFIYGGCRGNQNNFASMTVNIQLIDTSPPLLSKYLFIIIPAETKKNI